MAAHPGSGAGVAPAGPVGSPGIMFGGRGHQLAHAAVEVDLAFDVVLAHLADLAGDEVRERRQVVQAQRDRSVLGADPPAAGKNHGEGKTQGPEPLLEHTGDREHDGVPGSR